MIHKARTNDLLYIYSMGKRLRVTAMATDDDTANEYLTNHSNDAVIATFGSFVFMADKYDKGVNV